MNRFLRMTAVVLAAAFAFLLAGCGGSSASTSFTWFVDNIPANLDPQVATKAEDVIACENLYGGLVRRNASGELVPDLCERWEISSDGLTYTFYLKSGLTYTGTKGAATDYAITAEDFVYAFRRVFDPQTASPYAVEFSAIQNSAAVLDGTADPGTLGVSAIGELTLVFRLSERDDTFLSKLTLPGAMPCDEAFFESTRGTYGLSSASTLSSGSFYIYNWTASGLFLRRSAASPLVNNLRLVQNTSNTDKSAAQLIADEKCSAALDDTAEATSLQSVEYSDTTWALLFNASEGSVFAVASLRQALAGIALLLFIYPHIFCTLRKYFLERSVDIILKASIPKLREKLLEALQAVLPIVAIVLVLCFSIAPVSPSILLCFLLGAAMIIVGIMFFTLGAEMSMSPMGERVGAMLTKSRSVPLIIGVGFLLGFLITISEPDLQVLANQVT